MNWERWRIPVMLTPMMLVIVLLFFGGIGYGLLQSLGYQPRIGNFDLSLDAYANILFSDRLRDQFWSGLLLTLWVSFASTFLSAVVAVAAALLLRQTFIGKRLSSFLFQINLPIPHVVGAVGVLFLFSQSGFLSRLLAQPGIVASPSDFPIVVRDPYGFGIILAYLWKEVPFIGIIVLAVLQSLGEDYENLAASLGANRWQRFRYVVLPLILPGLLSASIIVFAFVFGAYETPALLGVRYPRMLPVTAVRFFLDRDLNARSEGMALSMIVTGIVVVLVIAYMAISRRVRGD